MAQIHLSSTGSNTAPYDTWAKAATTLATAIAALAAGDDLLVSNAHAETSAGISFALPGTVSAPCRVLSGVPGAVSGLASVSPGASFVSSTTGCSISGCGYLAGVSLESNTASAMSLNIGATSGNVLVLEDCTIGRPGTASTSTWVIGPSGAGTGANVTLINTRIKGGNAGQRIKANGIVTIKDGGLAAGSSALTGLFNLAADQRGARLTVDGFDASGAATTASLISTSGSGGASAVLRGVTLPAGWTGGPGGGSLVGAEVDLVDYQVGATHYPAWSKRHNGDIQSDLAVLLSGGYSRKWVTGAGCKAPATELRGMPVYISLAAGTARTVEMEVLTDNLALTTAEAWIEVDVFDSAGSWLYGLATGRPSQIAAAVNLATSAAAWTAPGVASPLAQKATVSVPAPAQAGYAMARLVIGKPTVTVWAHPVPTVI
ncbi:MAG TPA: hypothetical protein PKD29_01800 [Rhodocyclaceae bacterium]|nr:hypothetical protein [Rhodocyclaceae bacterium]